MSVASKLCGSVVRALDAVWEAECDAIEHRSALPAGLEVWDLTSLKLDLDRLRTKLVAAMAAEQEEQRQSEEASQ